MQVLHFEEHCLHSDVQYLSHTYQVLKQLMQTQSILDRKGLALSISLLLLSVSLLLFLF